MHQATMEICQEFDRVKIKYDVVDNQDRDFSYVDVRYKAKTGAIVSIKFVSEDDDADVQVRAFSLAHVPDERFGDVLKVINNLNCTYRFVKFLINRENDVALECDLPMNNANIGPCATEMFIRSMKIIDEALPEIMRAIWA